MTTLHTLTRRSYIPRSVLDRPSSSRPWTIRAVDLDRSTLDPHNPRIRLGTMVQLTTHSRQTAEVLALTMSALYDNVAVYRRSTFGLIRVFL